jgi:hypothetical protein
VTKTFPGVRYKLLADGGIFNGCARSLFYVHEVDCVWKVMAHAQKQDFVFRRNGRVHLNQQGRQFSLLLAAEVCASGVVMLDAPYSEVVWRVLATHSIRLFPLHFPSLRHRVPSRFSWTLLCSLSLHRGFQTYLASFSRVARALEDVTEPY